MGEINIASIRIGDIYIDPLPQNIKVSRKGGGTVYTLADGSEIVKKGKAGLATISFSSYTNNKKMLGYLKTAFCLGTPLCVVVSGIVSPIVLSAVIVSIDTNESGGSVDFVDYSIVLREYVTKPLEFIYDSSVLSEKEKSSVATTGKTRTQSTYTVRKGDTLWLIAKKFLGNGDKYKELAILNNIKNPNLIYKGQVIKLR